MFLLAPRALLQSALLDKTFHKSSVKVCPVTQWKTIILQSCFFILNFGFYTLELS